MKAKLKPLDEQVVVITGASSGIGRQSAVRFGRAGAKVVCVARNADALADVVREITAAGGTAASAVADVADYDQIKAAAEFAASPILDADAITAHEVTRNRGHAGGQ